jgi:hypothetical protein
MGSNPIQLHNGLWAAPFSGFASTGMYWWWDNYVDPLDLWGQLKGVSEFFKGEDLTLLKPGAAQVTPGKAQALTLQNPDQALVWIRNNAYEYSAGQKAYRQALKGAPTIGAWKYEPAMLSNLSITLNGLSDGTYQAAWFNPGQARWLADTRVTVRGSKVRLAVPDFSCDLAVKLEKKK